MRTEALGKQYRSFWALQDCTIEVPKGSISALVGPNGAGKSTLLKLLVGLSKPSKGSSSLLGKPLTQEADYVATVGYLAQDIPLYKQLTVQDHLELGARLNKRWDMDLAQDRLHDLAIPFDRPVGKLSGGQRAQVGLALALAKRPEVLLLDEPVAALDPLAREEFLSSLTQAVANADGALTVIMSSHLLGDLERVCDHLIVLAAGKTQLCGPLEDVLAMHKLLIGPAGTEKLSPDYAIIEQTRTDRQTTLLVRLHRSRPSNPGWQVHNVTAEEVVLAYMKQDRQTTRNGGER